MSVPLLRTKLFIPPFQPDLIPRPHLVAKVDNALTAGARLILVSAPAGYGKTTLVSEWVHRGRQVGEAGKAAAVSWLSLSEDENDEILFWRYLIAALAEANPMLGRGTEAYLQLQPAPIRGLLTHLLNQAASLPLQGRSWQIVLVLDDYHLIINTAIHEGMAFLLAHLPPQLRIMMITRADPPLPVARMQARAEGWAGG